MRNLPQYLAVAGLAAALLAVATGDRLTGWAAILLLLIYLIIRLVQRNQTSGHHAGPPEE